MIGRLLLGVSLVVALAAGAIASINLALGLVLLFFALLGALTYALL